MIRQFAKDSLIYTIPSVLSKGIGFFMLPLYTRVLGPAEYGVLDLFLIVGSIVNLTVALEINQAVAVFHAEEKDKTGRKNLVSTGLWFTLFCYTLFLLISLLLYKELSLLIIGREGFEYVFVLAIIYMYLNGIFLFLQNQFRWELRSMAFAASNMTMTFSTALFAFILAYGLGMGLEGILYAMIIGVLAGSILSIVNLLQSVGMHFDASKLKSMLKFSVPLVPSSICVFFSLYIDRLMINKLMTIEDVGVYGIAVRVASIVTILISSVSGSLTPLILQRHNEPETPQHISKIFHAFYAMALILFLGSSLFSHEFLRVMTTEDFYAAYTVIPALLMSTIFANLYIFTPGVFLVKKTYIVFMINFLAVTVNIILNYILIPHIGIMGAALGTLVSSIISFMIYAYYNHKSYPIPFRTIPIILSTILITILGSTGYLVTDLTVGIFIFKIAVLVIGVASLFFTGLVDARRMYAMFIDYKLSKKV